MLTNSSHVVLTLNRYYRTITSADEYVASVLFLFIALCIITSRKVTPHNSPSVLGIVFNYNYPIICDNNVFPQVRLLTCATNTCVNIKCFHLHAFFLTLYILGSAAALANHMRNFSIKHLNGAI